MTKPKRTNSERYVLPKTPSQRTRLREDEALQDLILSLKEFRGSLIWISDFIVRRDDKNKS